MSRNQKYYQYCMYMCMNVMYECGVQVCCCSVGSTVVLSEFCCQGTQRYNGVTCIHYIHTCATYIHYIHAQPIWTTIRHRLQAPATSLLLPSQHVTTVGVLGPVLLGSHIFACDVCVTAGCLHPWRVWGVYQSGEAVISRRRYLI